MLRTERTCYHQLMNTILDKNCQYHKTIGKEASLEKMAFGMQLEITTNKLNKLSALAPHDVIDCIKIQDNQKIWSRAIFLRFDRLKSITVRFLTENDSTDLPIGHIDVAPAKSFSEDFEWRNNLKTDDYVDFYLPRNGWAKFKVVGTSSYKNNHNELCATIDLEKCDDRTTQDHPNRDRYLYTTGGSAASGYSSGSYGDYSQKITKVKVHTPFLTKPGVHTSIKTMEIDDSEDFYWTALAEYTRHCILRPGRNNGSSSEYFVKYLNIFGDNGGFNFIIQVIEGKLLASDKTSAQMIRLIQNSSENLTQPFVKKYGQAIMGWMSAYLEKILNSNIRNIPQPNLVNYIDCMSFFTKRCLTLAEANAVLQDIKITIGVCCLKSDVLEKQFFGAKLIIDIEDALKSKDNRALFKKLADLLTSEQIFEKVIRGHPSLIEKSLGIFKALFVEQRLKEAHLQTLWDQILKTDSESRSCLLEMVKQVVNEMSRDQIRFLLVKMTENLPEITRELFDLVTAFGKLTVGKYSDREFTQLISGVVWKMFQTYKGTKGELSREIRSYLIGSMSGESYDVRLEEILGCVFQGINKTRNIKLLNQILNSSNVLIEKVTRIFQKSRIVETLLTDLKNTLEEKISLQIMSPTYESAPLPIGTYDQKGKSSAKNETQNGDEQKDLKHLLKFFTLISRPEFDREHLLFTFAHFQDLYQVVFKYKSTDKMIHDWLFKFLSSEKNPNRIEAYKAFFTENFPNIISQPKVSYFRFFVPLFLAINELERSIVDKQVELESAEGMKPSKKQSIKICLTPVDKLFGMDLLMNAFLETPKWALFREIGNFMANFYLCPKYGENENPELYHAQKLQLTELAIGLFKQKDLTSGQKGSVFLLKIIKLEEMIEPSELISLSQLRETKSIVLCLESEQRAIQTRSKLSVSENATVFELKKLIAKEFRLEIDKFSIFKDKSEEILPNNYMQTIESVGLKNLDTIVVKDAYTPVYSQAQLFDARKGDFTPQVMHVLREIFEDFSADGQMSAENLARFTSRVTNKSCLPDSQPVLDILKAFGNPNGDCLTEAGFIDFFRNAALNKQNGTIVIWQNLWQLGYKRDLGLKRKFKTYIRGHPETSLRYRLANDQAFMSSLFDHMKDCHLLQKPKMEVENEEPQVDPEIKIIFQLYGLLPINLNFVSQALATPTTLLNSQDNLYIWNYCNSILHALIFNEDFQMSLSLLSSSVDWKVFQKFLLTVITPDFIGQLCQRLTQIATEQQGEYLYDNIGSSILTLEKILKICVSIDNQGFIGEMHNITTYFLRNKTKKHNLGSLEKTASPVSQSPGSASNRPKESDRRNEDEALEANKLAKVKSIFEESQIYKPLIASLDFTSLNQMLLVLMSTLNFEKGETVFLRRHFLKNVIVVFIASIKLKESQLPLLLSRDSFRRVMMTGLKNSSKHFRQAYKSLYAYLSFNSHDIQTKIELLKILIMSIDSGNSEDFPSLVELACSLLSEIGDLKSKNMELAEFVHNQLNFGELFQGFKSRFLCHVSTEVSFDSPEDQLLTSYLTFLEKILKTDELVTEQLKVAEREALIIHLFTECLFSLRDGVVGFGSVKCKSKNSRSCALELVKMLIRNDTSLHVKFLNDFLNPLVQCLPQFQPAPVNYFAELEPKGKTEFLGIKNLGCVCYMIATLQQFYCTPVFRYGVMLASDHKAVSPNTYKDREFDDNLFHQFQKMMAYLDYSDRSDFNPTDFCLSYKDYSGEPINVAVQQDADEFLKVLLDRLENSLKGSPFVGILNSVFLGSLCNTITCKSCGYQKTNEENFFNLSLEVKKMTKIVESFDKLVDEEIISDYMCDKCKKKSDISKKASLKKLPNVLILSLKKMCFDLELLANVKIHTRYEFPMSINLRKYTFTGTAESDATGKFEIESPDIEEATPLESSPLTDQDFEYKLVGVVIHSGNAEYGHYTSLINANRKDYSRPGVTEDRWFEFDDSKVSPFNMKNFENDCFGLDDSKETGGFAAGMMNVETDSSKSAYLLVYEKVNKQPLVFPLGKGSPAEKQVILDNLVDPTAYTIKNNSLVTDFYNLKRTEPKDYISRIREDNGMLLLEEQILCKGFTNNIAEIFGNINFDKWKSLQGIERETEFANTKLIAELTLERAPDLFNKVYLATNSNTKIPHLVSAIEKSIKFLTFCKQLVPKCTAEVDLAIDRIMETALASIFLRLVTSLLAMSSDSHLRNGILEYIVGVFRACVDNFSEFKTDLFLKNLNENYFRTLDQSVSRLKAESSPRRVTPFDAIQIRIVKMVATMTNGIKALERNTTSVKKMTLAFSVLDKISVGNDFVLAQLAAVDMLSFYYTLHCQIDTTKHLNLEKALNSMLNTIVSLIRYEQAKTGPHRSQQLESIDQLELIKKALRENYRQENYECVHKLVNYYAENDQDHSQVLALTCLEGLMETTDSDMMGYMEALKALLRMNDGLKSFRIRLILGVPRLVELPTLHYKTKLPEYGLAQTTNLKKRVYNYVSPFGLEDSFLEILLETNEKTDLMTCVMIYYLLELMLTDDSIFEYMLRIEPPNYLSGHFCDWVAYFFSEFSKTPNFHVLVDKSDNSLLITEGLPELLASFQKRLESFASSQPQFKSDPCKVLLQEDFSSKRYSVWNKKAFSDDDFVPLVTGRQLYIIGKTLELRTLGVWNVAQDNSRLEVKISLAKVALTPSHPTGRTNLSIPQEIIQSNFEIDKFNIKSDDIKSFLNLDYASSEDNSDEVVFADDSQAQTHLKTSHKAAAIVPSDFILRITAFNSTDSIFNVRLSLRHETTPPLNEDIIFSIRAFKNEQMIYTRCLEDPLSSVQGLTALVSYRESETAHLREYHSNYFSEFENIDLSFK